MKIKNVLTVFGVISLVLSSNAQNTATSPYSAFGIGELLFDNNIENTGSGELSVVSTNPYGASANFYNPAANTNLNVTSFDFSVNTRMSQFDDGTAKSQKSATYISNISLAFPIGEKVRAGFGFQPFSSIGYDLGVVSENDEVMFKNTFNGQGGSNSLHVMGSYNLSKELSVGLRANYIFGDLQRNQIIATDGLALLTDYSTKSKVNGLQFTTGIHYTKRIGDNKELNIGGTYTLGSKLNAKLEDMTTTYALVDLIPGNIDTIQYSKVYGNLKLPQTVSFGASYRKDLNWMIGAQLDWGDWGGYQINGAPSDNIDTQFRVSGGGYWIPDFNSYKSYFNRVVYRIGGFYEATPLQFDDIGIKKYGMTLGFGFPVGKDRDASMLNVAFELGQIGKSDSQVVKENYANIKIGFTLNDVWFRKRVID